jgi:hypothetical protein
LQPATQLVEFLGRDEAGVEQRRSDATNDRGWRPDRVERSVLNLCESGVIKRIRMAWPDLGVAAPSLHDR